VTGGIWVSATRLASEHRSAGCFSALPSARQSPCSFATARLSQLVRHATAMQPCERNGLEAKFVLRFGRAVAPLDAGLPSYGTTSRFTLPVMSFLSLRW
jgi:hypothetical protein